MKGLFDNHNHSQFSFDGKRTTVEASALAAKEKGLGGICFSDHCDFYVPPTKAASETSVDEFFDIPEQQAEIERVQALLDTVPGPFKILKGIEIGMSEENHEQIRGTLNANSFDQIIASVHYIEQSDPFYGGFYDGKDWKQAYGRYLEKIYSEMTWLKDFDIMGHYDYIARYAPYEQTSITYRDFSDIFDAMFRYLIEEGKALELNTKGYVPYKGRTIEPDLDVLKRYREMGGEIISLGSDSHDACRTGDRFTEAAAMLKSLGFRWTAHYEKRKLVQVSI